MLRKGVAGLDSRVEWGQHGRRCWIDGLALEINWTKCSSKRKPSRTLTPSSVGYAARVALHSNPWNEQAFETQICAIILSPTLICISIYLTLKHLCQALGPSLSRVRPRLLPYLFVPADVSCLLVQAIGGSLAASGGTSSPALVRAGNRTIIAGIALQVVVLLVFGALSADYWLRARRWVPRGEGAGADAARALWADRRLRMFVGAVLGAYVCVLIRCIYRYVYLSV